MKRIPRISALLLVLLLAGCHGEQPKPTVPDTPPVQTEQPDTPVTPDSGEDEQVGEPAFTVVDDLSTGSWESETFHTGPFSFELPAGWKENTDMATETTMFFTDPSLDLSTHPSNVVVEILPPSGQDTPSMDFSDAEVQQTFFDFISQEFLPQISGMADPVFSVWQGESRYHYIVSYSRQLDGKTIQQTCYCPMGLGYSVIVYATDYGDGLSPDVNEIARRVTATFAVNQEN